VQSTPREGIHICHLQVRFVSPLLIDDSPIDLEPDLLSEHSKYSRFLHLPKRTYDRRHSFATPFSSLKRLEFGLLSHFGNLQCLHYGPCITRAFQSCKRYGRGSLNFATTLQQFTSYLDSVLGKLFRTTTKQNYSSESQTKAKSSCGMFLI